MAIKTADLMNDGTVDIYLAQIAGRSSGVSKKLKMQPIERYCDAINDPMTKAQCQTNMDIKTWYKSGNNFHPSYAARCQDMTGRSQAECKALLVKDLAIQKQDPGICALIPVGKPRPRSFCDLHFFPTRQITPAEADAALPQILRSNVLLEREAGAYSATADARGLEVGGWNWDTKIADFDNDGWQDVFIVNGTWVPNEVTPSNMFFHNTGEGNFLEASGPFGLEDYLMTAVATQFDMDDDGDLDIISHPVNGPVMVYRNNSQSGNAITIRLEDLVRNRDGIGATLCLTDAMGDVQMREVQLGGGFMSFDAPWVHFGLGEPQKADHLRIRGADGSETEVQGPLAAGQFYHLRRDF